MGDRNVLGIIKEEQRGCRRWKVVIQRERVGIKVRSQGLWAWLGLGVLFCLMEATESCKQGWRS